MTAFNVVRFRVKPGREEEFVNAHRDAEANFPGMRRVALALLLTSCMPRLAVTVRAPAKVNLGPVTRVAILTFESRLGAVMRERVRHDLAADGHFVLVRMCGERSCEPVDAFIRLYERDTRVVGTQNGNAMAVTIETERPVTPDAARGLEWSHRSVRGTRRVRKSDEPIDRLRLRKT